MHRDDVRAAGSGQGRARRRRRRDDAHRLHRRSRQRCQRTRGGGASRSAAAGPGRAGAAPAGRHRGCEDAAAQVDAAHQKNAEALDNPAPAQTPAAATPPPAPPDAAAAGAGRQPAAPAATPPALGVHLRPGRPSRSVRESAAARQRHAAVGRACGRQGFPGCWSAKSR